MTPQPRRCKECPPEIKRPTVPNYPGPRCATHARAHRKRAQKLAHARMIQNGYEISGEDYDRLYEAQGGRCALCLIATGKSKRLCVDHDHKLAAEHGHDPKRGCRRCIRGLLCSRCNRWGIPLTLGAVLRALEYLHNPPARKVLNP